jgi:hypothetical protein
MRNRIWRSLNRKVTGKITYLDYTVEELKQHLARYFTTTNKFTWDNYGSVWHIEHVVPLAWFKIEKPRDAQFRLAWSLHNLRPGLKAFNHHKSNRLVADISRPEIVDMQLRDAAGLVFLGVSRRAKPATTTTLSTPITTINAPPLS